MVVVVDLACAANSIKVFNVATGRVRYEISTMVKSLAWSPDGRRLAGVREGFLTIWDASNGQFILALPFSGMATSVCWGRGGKSIIVGGQYRNIRVYKARDGILSE